MSNKKIYLFSNLKYLRKKKNLTQAQVGKICGKSDRAISTYENGTREPDVTDLGSLSDFFEVTIDELLFKDLKEIKNNYSFEYLYDKYKKILTDDDKEHIVFMINKRKKENDTNTNENEQN